MSSSLSPENLAYLVENLADKDPDRVLHYFIEKYKDRAHNKLLEIAAKLNVPTDSSLSMRDVYLRIAAVISGKSEIGPRQRQMPSAIVTETARNGDREEKSEEQRVLKKRGMSREKVNVSQLEEARKSFISTHLPPSNIPTVAKTLVKEPTVAQLIKLDSDVQKRKSQLREEKQEPTVAQLIKLDSDRQKRKSQVKEQEQEVLQQQLLDIVTGPSTKSKSSNVGVMDVVEEEEEKFVPHDDPYILEGMLKAGGGPFDAIDYASSRLLTDVAAQRLMPSIASQSDGIKALETQYKMLSSLHEQKQLPPAFPLAQVLNFNRKLLAQRQKYLQMAQLLITNPEKQLSFADYVLKSPTITQCLQIINLYFDTIINRADLQLQIAFNRQKLSPEQLQKGIQQIVDLDNQIASLKSQYLTHRCASTLE